MGLTMQGIPEMQSRIASIRIEAHGKLKMIMSSIMSEMATWIKNNHSGLSGWENRTGNLESSISSAVTEEGGKIVGVVYAGMDYAVYVEYREGHWVISAALEEYKSKVMTMVRDRLRGLW